MQAATEHEYLCPHCGHINVLQHHELRDKCTEQYAKCDNCAVMLEIVPADGIDDQINLIVTEAPQELVIR